MARFGMVGPGGMNNVNNVQKPKDFLKTWKKLILYCKPYLPAIIIALLLSVVGTILSIIGPKQLSKISDLMAQGLYKDMNITEIEKIGVMLASFYVIGFIFNYVQGFIMATVTQKISKNLRDSISKKINILPLNYFDTTNHGNILSCVTNDIDTISQTLNQSIGSLITASTTFLGSLIMMFTINFTLTISAILSTAFGFSIMMSIIVKSQKYFNYQQQSLGMINGHIEEIYSSHDIVKVYNGENIARKTFNKINGDLYESAWKSQFLSGIMMPIMSFISNFGYVVVCVVGAFLATKGDISFGVIVAFMIYIRLFTQPLSQFAQAATNLQSTAAASERVFKFLDQKELENEDNKKLGLRNVKGEVEFKNVRFGYNENKIIVKNFSMHAKPGQKIAIVGPTGAGKTTMVNLLMRFYEICSGAILIDGIDINSLKRENVHDIFCMVLQDTWLFEGTIKENIVYNKRAIEDDKVVSVCKLVGIHHFIGTLPKGYNTVLDDNITLSEGQKQLITIARAIIKNSPMLILDEATSSVDTRTEILIQNAMDKLMTEKTSFVIAHRLSTIKNADIILVMKDGDIIEKGNHSDLMSQKGFYFNLYNSQFEKV